MPCGKQFESLQTMKERKLTKCPECKKETLQRCLSLSGFRLTGGGWFKDGYEKDKES
jgi:putative FmdB family regulatory protein